MADQKDYYETLGVSRDADDDTIRKAFRKLSKIIIPILITHPVPSKSLRKSTKPIRSCLIPKSVPHMTNMGLLMVRRDSAMVVKPAGLVTSVAVKAVSAALTTFSVNSLAALAVVHRRTLLHRGTEPTYSIGWI